MNELKKLLRNKRAVESLRLASEMRDDGQSEAEIRKALRQKYAGAPWLDLLIQFLPVLLKLLEKLLG